MPLHDPKRSVRLMMRVEDYVSARPLLHGVLSRAPRALRGCYFKRRGAEGIFREIADRNLWGDSESRSGAGSNLIETRSVRRDLPPLLRALGVRSLLDIPCGDHNWMKEIELGSIKYIGADIVEALVEANTREYGTGARAFLRLDIRRDRLPKVDLVLVRDCLVHLSYTDIVRALRNICDSGSEYLLTTTFPCRRRNRNIAAGDWRPLNLQIEPFSFPEPIRTLYEDHPAPEYSDKSLALWRISDISKCLP